jgi:deoxyribodipyrimidine photo-lyase
MHPKTSITIFWFRRDLRLEDNAALYYALKENQNVLPLFIFDKEILNQLEDNQDKRVDFIHQALEELQGQIKGMGSSLLVKIGTPAEVYAELVKEYTISAVYTNHDYEPYAITRDNDLQAFLGKHSIPFHTYKDQVIFEKNEVLKDDGKPYTIFTPFMRKWKSRIKPFYLKSYPSEKYFSSFIKSEPHGIPSLEKLGFKKTDLQFSLPGIDEQLIKNYNEQRDYPGLDATSHLGIHLRFGTISIRRLAREAFKLNETFLNELIWREFYMMILFHFPHVVDGAFKPQYNAVNWRNNEKEFQLWCEGKTGYPIVDAGMRQLNETGFMHNRVRMITASFLVKDLLIDWRWGEAYFAKKLLDYELASNNGGWQWAAGTGCDAAPYFRIFNPTEQTKKFDPKLTYIKKWVPEYDGLTYTQPIVDHKFARERTLTAYKKALNEK